MAPRVGALRRKSLIVVGIDCPGFSVSPAASLLISDVVDVLSPVRPSLGPFSTEASLSRIHLAISVSCGTRSESAVHSDYYVIMAKSIVKELSETLRPSS